MSGTTTRKSGSTGSSTSPDSPRAPGSRNGKTNFTLNDLSGNQSSWDPKKNPIPEKWRQPSTTPVPSNPLPNPMFPLPTKPLKPEDNKIPADFLERMQLKDALAERIESLEKENAELRKRLERLEALLDLESMLGEG